MDTISVVTGTPLLGEPLPIELANTIFTVRGRRRDGLATPADLAGWLRHCGPRLDTPLAVADLRSTGEAEATAARDLRDTIRALLTATVSGRAPQARLPEALNRQVRAAVRWRELRWDNGFRAEYRADVAPVTAALAELAAAAVDLFAGPDRADLRACHAPNCVLFFLKNHPRREWCSAGCGNRARVARHYERVKKRHD